MPLIFAFRVQEVSDNAPSAVADYNLSGTATTGHKAFALALANGDECYVLAEQLVGNNIGGGWELARCTFVDSAPDRLQRDTVLDSSNSGAAIDWSVISAPRLSLVADLPDSYLRAVDKSREIEVGYTLKTHRPTLGADPSYTISLADGNYHVLDGWTGTLTLNALAEKGTCLIRFGVGNIGTLTGWDVRGTAPTTGTRLAFVEYDGTATPTLHWSNDQ